MTHRLSNQRLLSLGRKSSLASNKFITKSLGRNSGTQNSANSLHKILNRPFHIERDLPKYSQDLNYKQSERRLHLFEKTATGRMVPNLELLGHAVKFCAQWEYEKKQLKNVDWSQTILFTTFKDYTDNP